MLLNGDVTAGIKEYSYVGKVGVGEIKKELIFQ